MLGFIRKKWNGILLKPVPFIMAGIYPNGVTLTRAKMKKVEQRLERSATLPKYDILIWPREE